MTPKSVSPIFFADQPDGRPSNFFASQNSTNASSSSAKGKEKKTEKEEMMGKNEHCPNILMNSGNRIFNCVKYYQVRLIYFRVGTYVKGKE